MSTLYVLQLEDGKYYVGRTDDIAKRYAEHKSGRGSEWTKAYKPIKMLETHESKSAEDETNLTKFLMKKYGMDNVRGGAFCQKELPDYVEKTLRLEQRGNSNACYKCGRQGHFANKCPNGIEGDHEVIICGDCNRQFASDKDFDKHYCNPMKKSSSGNTCYRCGRYGHWANQCYAKSTVDGDELDSDDDYDSE